MHHLLKRGSSQAGSTAKEGDDLLSPLIAYAKKEKHAELLEAANVIRANHRRTANDLEAATAELRLLESRADRLAEGERAAVLARATDRVQRARAAYQSGRRSMLNLINRFQLKVGDSQPTTTTERAVKAIEAIGSDEALLFYTFVEDRLVLLSKQAGKGTSDKAIKSTPLRWPDGRPVTGESLDRAIQQLPAEHGYRRQGGAEHRPGEAGAASAEREPRVRPVPRTDPSRCVGIAAQGEARARGARRRDASVADGGIDRRPTRQ